TLENMKFSKEIIDDVNAKVLFSTTNYHVFRSGIFASQAGLEAEGTGSKTKWYFWPNAFIREFVGLIVSQKKKIIPLTLIIILIAVASALVTF
ncbi:MAG: YdcF family protein, partial [Acutalibacteraceae bacterium]